MTSATDFARGVNPRHSATTVSFHITDDDQRLNAGDVIRVFDGPFGDAIILGFDERGHAKCSRPYAYASSVGTTGPTVLLGAETIIYGPRDLMGFSKVGKDRVTT